MTASILIDEDLRNQLIDKPETILEDNEIMSALIAANERAMGTNIVDLRGIAMERLEQRLDRLEQTHRSVIAAAYENLSGMNLIHRAVLRMLDPADFEVFVSDLAGEVAEILRVDCLRLVLETPNNHEKGVEQRLGKVLRTVEPGVVARYLGEDHGRSKRQVFLRQIQDQSAEIYGETSYWIRSEACIRLDFGKGRLPGLLVLGVEDPHQYKAGQGVDLLEFFGGVFERAMRRWLS